MPTRVTPQRQTSGREVLPPEALYRDVAERATASLPEGSQGDPCDDEAALRAEMSRLGLQVTYRRPHPRRVERAMADATAMLIDCGRLSERYFSALDRIFRNADPSFVITRPTRRPSLVALIPERAQSRYLGGDWTTGVTMDNAITGRTTPLASELPTEGRIAKSDPERSDWFSDVSGGSAAAEPAIDDWIVLAEETWLRWLDWKLATETRVGARLEPTVWARVDPDEDVQDDDIDGDTAAGLALDSHVAAFSHLTADEYLAKARSSHSIIVRNVTYRFGTPGGYWLAFNPALAEHVDWRPSSDGLFRWLDADGDVVAESVWWQDGFAQQRPPQFDDEVGHGWLVRVSTSGWRQLAAALGPCVDWCRVARLAQEQQPTTLVTSDPVVGKQRQP